LVGPQSREPSFMQSAKPLIVMDISAVESPKTERGRRWSKDPFDACVVKKSGGVEYSKIYLPRS
jgi:hypothetical protein